MIYLTRVQRHILFPGPAGFLLMDKTRLGIVAGPVGMLLFALLFGWHLLIFPVDVLLPWLTATAIDGHPRMLEAAISRILSQDAAWRSSCLERLSAYAAELTRSPIRESGNHGRRPVSKQPILASNDRERGHLRRIARSNRPR